MPSITDYFAHASNGSGMPVVTYLASTKSSGATSLSVNAATNWPTATCVNILLYMLEADGKTVTPGSVTMWKGILSGTTVGSLTLKGGTDTTYAGGTSSVVEMAPTSSWADDVIFGLLVEHTQAGLHSKVNGNTVPSGTDTVQLLLATQTVENKTLDHTNSVDSRALTLSGAAAAVVATSETTTSTSYADLATTTDTVTVTIGPTGMALVVISSGAGANATDQQVFVSYAVSGANTNAASDNWAINSREYTANAQDRLSVAKLWTGLSAGSTTFKMKYRTTGNTGTFVNREISVIPL